MEASLTTLMLQRCAQTIEQVISPNLSGGFEFEQAMYIAILLHILAPAVEEKTQEVQEENESMRRVLGQVVQALRDNAVGPELAHRLDARLATAAAGQAAAGEASNELKGAVVDAIKGLDSLAPDLPEETVSSLRGEIRGALRQQLDHGVQRVIHRMGGMVL